VSGCRGAAVTVACASISRPVFAFLDSGIRQSNHRNLIGVAPSGVDFYLYFKRFNTDYRGRIDL